MPDPTPDPTPHTPDTDHEVDTLDHLAGDAGVSRDDLADRDGRDEDGEGGSQTGNVFRSGS